MNLLRRINLSAAIIVLVCFFLPWVQVSCAGARDTVSGLDLARDGHTLLWLIPLLMVASVVLGLTRTAATRLLPVNSVVSLVGGLLTIYFMNRERLRVHDESGLITAQLTGWFWLGLFSSVAIVIAALALLVRGRRSRL